LPYVAAGPADLEAYAAGRDTNAGVRGIFKIQHLGPSIAYARMHGIVPPWSGGH
jgi:hypothetical protein